MFLLVIFVIFEMNGELVVINGFYVIGLYIGVFFVLLFMEVLLRKFGYKLLMVMGGFFVIISLFSFIWF